MRLIWDTSPVLATINIFLRLLRSLYPVSSLYVGKLIIDEIVHLSSLEGPLDYTYLLTLIGIEFGLALFSDALNRGIILSDSLLGDRFANRSSVELMRHAAQMDLAQFEKADFYDKLERARRQTTGRVRLMSQILSQMQDLITILSLGAGLVLFNSWLILLLIFTIIPAFLSESYFNRSTYSLVRSWTPERRELDYLRYIGASDETAKEIKLFNLSDFITTRFEGLAEKYYQANRKLAIKRSIWGMGLGILSTLGYYGAYTLIIYQTVIRIISLGDLTFLSGSFSRLQSLLQGMLSRFNAIAQDALYLQDWFAFFDIKPKIVSPPSPRHVPKVIQKGFTFEQVGFKYPNTEQWAIKNISFHLNAGEKLALVGENGAGKTTLVKLIARLYDPDEGRILLDGIDIKEYNLQEYRQMIGVIFQDFVKYYMMMSDNIAVGKIDKREDEELIQKSAQLSLADSVIDRLPQGYSQMLGRRFVEGVELSGGEWQKVALARAYMRDAALLILDEPTAALDARAEYEVFIRFSELTQGKAAVLISHRFSTVRMADRILVLKQGQQVELGTHSELLDKGGLYAELFNLQAEGYR